MSVLVSAIIVNYNAADLTARAAASISDDKDNTNVEIIIVDNSESRSEHNALRKLNNTNVRLIINEKNIGFGRACNHAYEVAKGKYVLLLNPDAYLLPGALSKLVDFLENNPRAGAVCPRIYWDDERIFLLPPAYKYSQFDCIRDQLFHSSSWLLRLYSHFRRRRTIRILRMNRPIKQSSLSGGLVLISREAIESSGGLFDPRFFMYFEDTDLFRRVLASGYHLYMEPSAMAVHNYNQCGNDLSDKKRIYMQESYESYLDKYDPHGWARYVCKILSNVLPKATPPRSEYLGVLAEPPVFPINFDADNEWVMEWSPNPDLIPSAVYFGSGYPVAFPEEAWKLLGPGRYYVRFGNTERFFSGCTWHWDIQNKHE